MSARIQEFAVSPQIMPEDVAEIAAAGFKSIICNRPDGEEAHQPDFAVIEKAAAALGLETRYIPIIAGQRSEADMEAFAKAAAELPRPILAYCRSGARANLMWELTQGT